MKVKSGIGVPRTELQMVGCETPRGCRKQNLGPLQKQQALLPTEPPDSHPSFIVVKCPTKHGSDGV